MAKVGYQRVSSVGQNEVRQLDGLTLDKVFCDKQSGKNTDRPELQRCLEYVREGDELICHSMDRLARSTKDLLQMVADLTGRGVTVRFVKEGLNFTGVPNPMNDLLLGVLGSIAQFERALILERQREGIAIAVREGKYKGSKPKLSGQQVVELCGRAVAGESKTELAREYGVSRETVYALLRAATNT